jgi:hypothetical protein
MAQPLLLIVLGLILILFGRSLYWAFLAVAGFLMGMELAADLLADQEPWVRFLAALAAGALGAILGVLAQRIAFAVGGFFAGGYLTLSLLDHVPQIPPSNLWFLVGGILGAIVAAMVLDWAIIVLASLAGAVAVMSGIQGFEAWKLPIEAHTLGVVALAAVGIFVQGRRLNGAGELPAAPPAA